MTCARPGNLDVLDYKETLRMVESDLSKALATNTQLLLRIDQLKWENDKLKDQVEMLSLDLGVGK